jgi:hypothetical protein
LGRKELLLGTVKHPRPTGSMFQVKDIEVSRDVTFHEEAAFKQSKELQLDTETEEPEEPLDQFDTVDPVEQIERPLEVPPAKRKPAWCREILREAKKHAAPSGTFRESNRPQRYSDYVALMSQISDAKPTIYEDAAKDATVEEYQSIMKNDVWEVVPRPKGKSVVSSKWIYKIKHAADGSIETYKARFVASGFSQKEGINYDETFPPVARYTSIRTIISLASVLGWKLHQMDVKTTFLNGQVEEEVYLEQPYGFVVHKKESHVCK